MLRAADTTTVTDTGRQRRENEDSLFVREPVFVVADGMGGAQAGEVASQVAVEAFEDGLPESGSAEERLRQVVQEANRRIHELSRTQQERQGMGTTLTAAYLEDAILAIAHVGDSRAYLFRDGSLQRLTQDHSLVAELVRRGKLTEEQAEEHPQRSIITRALGIEPTVEIDTFSYPVRSGDVLLLCSDGLTSMVGEERITQVLSEASSLERAGRALVREANEAGGRDNITVILTRLEDARGSAAEGETFIATPAADAESEQRFVAPRDATGGPSSRRTPPRGSAPVLLERTPNHTASRRSPRPARPREPRGPVSRTRRGRRWGRPAAALLATLIVLALILGGGFLASRQLYFIGTDSQGIVTIYRGLPYQLPAGIDLYETFYVSGLPASLIPADRRGPLLDDRLRSQAEAQKIVRQLELGEIAG